MVYLTTCAPFRHCSLTISGTGIAFVCVFVLKEEMSCICAVKFWFKIEIECYSCGLAL
jgi:hypothetical protein